MYKIIAILLIGSCLFQIGIAQTTPPATEVIWGEQLREPNNTVLSKIIATTSDRIYALRIRPGNTPEQTRAIIESYDRKLNLKRSQELNLKYKNKKRQFEDVIRLGGELYLLTSFHNQAKRKNYLFKQKISSKRFTTSSRDIELIGEYDNNKLENAGQFDIVQSRDTSKLLVYHQLPFRRGTPESFKLRVFDENFQELWTRPIILPYNNEEFIVDEYRVDRTGNVYIVGRIFENGRRTARLGNPNYRYTILAYTNSGQEFNEYRIDLPNHFITDFTFRVANDGNLVCTGFYSERGTASIKGTYFFRLDATTKQISNQNLKEFDFELLTEFMSDRQKDKAQRAIENDDTRRAPELYRISLDHLILRSDGGALLIGEQFFVQERTYSDFPFYYGAAAANRIRRDFYYYYNDIIVVNIKPNGEIEWTARVPKRQVTINDGGYYSSYAMSIVRDKIYLIFNDNSRNFSNNKPNRIFNFDGRNSIVALAEISRTGQSQVTPLFDNREADVLTRPKICGQIGRKEMLIFGELGRGFRFGKILFE